MRRLLLAPLLLLVPACKGETAKDVTATVVGKTVEVAKGAGSGVVEGFNEGRKGAASADGSRTLSTAEEVNANTELSVLEAKASNGGGVEVVLAVTNKTAEPLHLLGLHEGGGAQLLDKDGFATPLQARSPGQSADSIKVPPSVKVKASIYFDGEAEKAAKVRVWGRELTVPAAATAAKPQP
ncbi:hypothetical protein LXT21_08320 [Myxococcus sp. K38C18041901]|uniref:hypothetical protein n=1 Tax=Myxococcus guangdongensis TaxID=2906760 RepID=UPI0020A7F0CD|nr:hypothetical protein [Myxococcus guangdongensis]MCP3058773.1 hypothetical protein [Myxococcus guangdongensis]